MKVFCCADVELEEQNNYLQVDRAATGGRRKVNLQFCQQLLVLSDPVAQHIRVVCRDDCHL